MCEVFGKPLTEKFKQRGCVNGGFPCGKRLCFSFASQLFLYFVFYTNFEPKTANGQLFVDLINYAYIHHYILIYSFICLPLKFMCSYTDVQYQ